MSRTLTGKQHNGVLKVKQKNGDIYVYERVTAYNEETRKTYTVKKTLMGKIPFGSDTMVVTRKKKPSKPKQEPSKSTAAPAQKPPVEAERKRIGSSAILEWVGKESGISSDLNTCFFETDAQKIETLVHFWISTNGSTLPHLLKWQLEHDLPYKEGMSEESSGRLFDDIAMNEGAIQSYFSLRTQRHGIDRPIIALDTTAVDSYSDNLCDFRYGFSKESGKLPSQKILTLMSVNDMQPISFETQPGNIPDVISIKNSIDRLKITPTADKPLIVFDNGFYSKENCSLFAKENMHFLARMPKKTAWIKEAFEQVKDEVYMYSKACPFDKDTYGMTVAIDHEYKLENSDQTLKEKAYIHFFYSEERGALERRHFNEELDALTKLVKEGKELSTSAKNKVDKYLNVITDDDGNLVSVSPNDKNIRAHWKELGFFILHSNSVSDTFKALEYYRWRNRIENMYEAQKNITDGKRPRVRSSSKLKGRQFVQFVGMGYYCFLVNKIKEIKQNLGKKDDSKTATMINLEKALKSWLDNVSICEILEWFDCVTQLRVNSQLSKRVITSETTKRDDLFLKLLGITN